MPRGGLGRLERSILACERCPRLRRHCSEVAAGKKRAHMDETYWGRPVPGFGDSEARLLIVGLAPAAHGANRTGRMFTGDSSGDWLYEALHRYGFANHSRATARDDGLELTDAFISAAARCAPPANKPTGEELRRCRPLLETEIRLLRRVEIVLALGRVAHEAWLKAAGWWRSLPPGSRPPFAHGAHALLPDRILFVSSYHPSRQNTHTGRLTRRMWHRVFARIRTALDASRARVPPRGRSR